jgi:EpsI family protein
MNALTPNRRRAVLVLGGALLAATSAKALRPTKYMAAGLGPIDLERNVPAAFGSWRQEPSTSTSVINPEVSELLSKLYSEILERAYVNRETGYRVMVSIAYGGDQSDSLSLHYPDVCYPAQGFQVRDRHDVELSTKFGGVAARRLTTQMGTRHEPVTYWVIIGDRAVSSGVTRKLVQMQFAARGWIPDGLLFRLSSIDPDTEAAFEQQASFARALAAELSDVMRRRLFGISPA